MASKPKFSLSLTSLLWGCFLAIALLAFGTILQVLLFTRRAVYQEALQKSEILLSHYAAQLDLQMALAEQDISQLSAQEGAFSYLEGPIPVWTGSGSTCRGRIFPTMGCPTPTPTGTRKKP